jgi:hypothetical protein
MKHDSEKGLQDLLFHGREEDEVMEDDDDKRDTATIAAGRAGDDDLHHGPLLPAYGPVSHAPTLVLTFLTGNSVLTSVRSGLTGAAKCHQLLPAALSGLAATARVKLTAAAGWAAAARPTFIYSCGRPKFLRK